jgi:hypothetical protein
VPATEAVTRLARDLATTTAERSSAGPRAPGHGPAGSADERRTRAGGGGSGGEGGDGGDGGASEHRIDACGVCPICVGLRAIGEARPDLVVHLAEAARQLALAVRTVVDAAAPDGEAGADPGTGRRASRRRAPEDLHHIDLDD